MWHREDFFQYTPGMNLDDFPKDKVPLLQMEHLRQMDFMISKAISYERTAYTFLAQIELNSRLHIFKTFPNAAVLLDREGAMIRHDNEWDIIYTPSKQEGNSLEEDDDMVPVYEEILDSLLMGEKAWARLNHVSVRSLMKNKPDFNILDLYCRKYPGGYLAVAERIVTEGTDDLYANVPVCRYGLLSSVDLEERESYDSIKNLMDDYIYAVDHADGKQVRPLSVAVFGAPGSGKSFGVKQIAKSFGKFDIFTLNCSQYNNYDEMLVALDNALNEAEKIPLIFFDEFDSEYEGSSRGWLKFFLAPMQDGEYTVNGKIRTINHAVFVFAGGTASSFDGFLPANEEEALAFKAIKGPDFVSRLRGNLNIKGPNPTSVTDKSYIIRRAMLLRDMLKRKAPQLLDKETGRINISHSLLSALLRTTVYKHGTRSMEFLIDMSRLSGVKKFTPSCLPMENQLNIHLDYVDLNKKLAVDRIIGAATEEFISKSHEMYRDVLIKIYTNNGFSEEAIERLKESNTGLKTWDELSESDKEEYRIRLRTQAEEMESIDFPVGIRPCTENMPDTIHELYGYNLEMMTKLDHECWLKNKLANGWKYGPVEDTAVRISPQIRPYDELSNEEKELKLRSTLSLCDQLHMIGMELYKKAH